MLGFSAEAGEYLLASVCPASQPARDGLLPKNDSNNSAGLGGFPVDEMGIAGEMGPLPRDSMISLTMSQGRLSLDGGEDDETPYLPSTRPQR